MPLNIVNLSLHTGVFPTAFKTAVEAPSEETNLDPDNYCRSIQFTIYKQHFRKISLLPIK